MESFVVESALPFSVQSSTGKNVLIRGIGMQTMSVPLHRIALSSDLVQGDVIVGVRLALPVLGVQMILGNNLAGDRVWLSGPVTPVVSNEPAEATKKHECVEEFPEVFTACAVTRARSLAESGPSAAAKPAIPSLPNLPQSLSRNKVVLAQKDDEGLVELYARAVTTETLQSDQGGYFIVDGLLVRNFVHNELNETWLQIIIPKKYRGLVLKTAHGDVAGHFGVRKTYNSVVRHFYWPRMKKDVARFIKTCHVCQLAGKPNQSIKPAPLYPKAVGQPFGYLLIDCVGPLPPSKSGCVNLLTVSGD
jgi:hypothetical protein